MKDPKIPINLKYNHLLPLNRQPDTDLLNLLEQLDTLYHAPQTPPHLTSYGFEMVKGQLKQQSKQARWKGGTTLYRWLTGAILLGLATLLGLALTNNWLKELYEFCFSFGLVFSLASLVLGGLGHLGALHFGPVGHIFHTEGANQASADLPGGVDPSAVSQGPLLNHYTHQGGGEKNNIGWFSLTALVIFITWFGGAGFILISVGMAGWLTIILGILAGIAGYLLIWLVLKLLISSQTPLMQGQYYQLAGTVGQINSTILENGWGEVVYTQFGSLRSSPARSQDGQMLPRGTKVVILSYSQGVAYVQDLEKSLSELNQAQEEQGQRQGQLNINEGDQEGEGKK